MVDCVLCSNKASVRHHVCYYPVVKTIFVCNSCHNRIHKGELNYLAPSHKHALIFYSKKGHLLFGRSRRIKLKDYDFSDRTGFIFCFSRCLSDKELFMRDVMRCSDNLDVNKKIPL